VGDWLATHAGAIDALAILLVFKLSCINLLFITNLAHAPGINRGVGLQG